MSSPVQSLGCISLGAALKALILAILNAERLRCPPTH